MKNKKSNPIINSFRLVSFFNRNFKIKFFLLGVLIVINSITEILSISAVIPFLLSLTNPEKIKNNIFLNFFSSYFELTNDNLVFLFSITFGVFVIISSFLKLLTLKFTCNFCSSSVNYLASKGYLNYLNQNYEFYLKNKSSDLINTLTIEMIKAQNSLECLFQFFSSSFLSILILITLLIVNPELTIIIFLSIGVIYLLISKNIQSKLLNNSKIISKSNSTLIKMLQESFGGIREILLSNSQNYFKKIFSDEDLFMRYSLEKSKFYRKSPRYFVEALGIILLILTTIFIITFQKNENIISVLGFIAFSFQKLLTAAQSIYSNWSNIYSFNSSVLSVLDTLILTPRKNSMGESNRLKLNNKIVLNNIVYTYKNQKHPTLNGINLTINKGEVVGIIGKTGCGKSTLTDIINGLLKPSSGDLLIDDENIYKGKIDNNLKMWQKNIAHVPQNVYISNDSILKNIAFGVEYNLIDESRVFKAAKDSCLANDINRMSSKYKTFVGERGSNLSGGQLQRLGIARALYKNKDLLILDEITSSLDKNTENQIIKLLDSLSSNLTIIIISHRMRTLKTCDKVFELKEGKLFQVDVKGLLD